jgi:hypothetical protein
MYSLQIQGHLELVCGQTTHKMQVLECITSFKHIRPQNSDASIQTRWAMVKIWSFGHYRIIIDPHGAMLINRDSDSHL